MHHHPGVGHFKANLRTPLPTAPPAAATSKKAFVDSLVQWQFPTECITVEGLENLISKQESDPVYNRKWSTKVSCLGNYVRKTDKSGNSKPGTNPMSAKIEGGVLPRDFCIEEAVSGTCETQGCKFHKVRKYPQLDADWTSMQWCEFLRTRAKLDERALIQ